MDGVLTHFKHTGWLLLILIQYKIFCGTPLFSDYVNLMDYGAQLWHFGLHTIYTHYGRIYHIRKSWVMTLNCASYHSMKFIVVQSNFRWNGWKSSVDVFQSSSICYTLNLYIISCCGLFNVYLCRHVIYQVWHIILHCSYIVSQAYNFANAGKPHIYALFRGM